MASIRLEGLDTLIGTLKDNVTLDDVRTVVKKRGADLTQTMKAQTTIAYVKGYSSGDTAGSINLKITNGGLTAEVSAGTSYAPYVEWGTRYMSPEPIAQPSLDKIKPLFFGDLQRLMK